MSQSLTCLQIGISTPDTQQIWRPTDTTVCQSQRPIDNIISVIDLPINLSKLFDLKTKIRWNAKFHCKNRFNHVPVLRKASNSDWGLQYHLTFIVKHFFAQTRSNNHEVWVTDFLENLVRVQKDHKLSGLPHLSQCQLMKFTILILCVLICGVAILF